jgi:hypothetical protein
MVVYNFADKAEINIYLLITLLLLVIFGSINFYISSDIEGEENWVTRLFSIPKKELIISKKIPQMMGITIFLVVLFVLFFHFKNFLYHKKIDWFENVKTVSGRIDFVNKQNIMGINSLTIEIDSLTFSIISDEYLINQISLLKNDSVKIDYFTGSNKVLNKQIEDITVVKIMVE